MLGTSSHARNPHPLRRRVLIVDDEDEIREVLALLVLQEGYEPLQAGDGDEALAMIRRDVPDVLLLDIRMPGRDGMDVLHQAKKVDPALPVVMITSHGAVKNAVDALRAGAHDYLVKPFDHADVIRSLRSAMSNRALQRTVALLSDQTLEAVHLHEMMGPSEAVSRICAAAAQVAGCDFTVLIIGETGSGKELVARAIHQMSPSAQGPFVAVDCGAIPEALFESELFGHEKGAFTGADRSKPGKLELAIGGTLFLDEVSNMPLGSQAKLLRALQERSIHRVGGTKSIHVPTRVLAAANDDLDAAMAKGQFRKDLFFRLDEFAIWVAPLRERKEDIIFLAKRFLDQTNHELGKSIQGISEIAVQRLLADDWPGNVRQLRSIIRRAVLLAETMIDIEHLGLSDNGSISTTYVEAPPVPEKGIALKELLRRATMPIERAALLHTLKKTGWNKAEAARLLQIDYKTMHNKLKEYGLQRPRGERDTEEES